MKTVSQEKNDKKNDIFQIAHQIKKEEEEAQQAAKIMNAYRKVQDIKTRDTTKKPQKKTISKKPQSQYANKIKETLKQLNANRHKEQKQIKTKKIEFKVQRSQAERHLLSSGSKKIFKVLQKRSKVNLRSCLDKIAQFAGSEYQEMEELIRVWKLRRIFSAWNYQAMLSKIEQARVSKEKVEKESRSLRLANDFRYFMLSKKTVKGWKSYTKKELLKKQYEEEQRQRQIAQILEQEPKEQEQKSEVMPKKNQVQKNHELQNKLRGFLDNLKHEIDGKQRRLNTIKQKTEDSQLQARINTQQFHSQRGEEAEQNEDQENEEKQNEEQDNNLNSIYPNPVEQAGRRQPEQSRHAGPLSNQELEKRRRQLAEKAKSRKQALYKLKRQKEGQKKKQEEQRLRIQKQIQDEQKRVRQEQYRKFLKQKQQIQAWEEREKQLNKMADQFNRLRLVKFNGWLNWRKLREATKQQCHNLSQVLTKIIMRRKIKVFIQNVSQVGKAKLSELQRKIDKVYVRKLFRKSLVGFKNEMQEQLELKQELSVRHEVNTIKVFFRAWQRGRGELQIENFEWERPRMKRAECLYSMTLMQKVMKTLKLNQEEQIKMRNIQQHKEKIRQTVKIILQEKPTIDYDDFL